MKYAYELYPGEFFLEKKSGSGSWTGLSRDLDFDVMKVRFSYQVEMAQSGDSIRLLDHKKNILEERTI